ncbi:mechanosensitive ion channel protein MscS [Neoasaia chiangmaiensis NBRC 101099]|uniref:Uncharacterized protein n=1 Tax=Neoasaia chiangmaiensis TaxID=320497 RepID=A0A1U9KQT4_9PROT|nr:mechanosensitive ion channel domain-containing protein [Neoasaia chiangmaiensis]AQS88221.1 hypothetical protein A0U93_10005 [Neoasaia chiangmaiensis]GBR39823.1 mechanosensitive ion channel protein MscS [Neoasaia chiangmaiensis NBRC 101099]GEN14757.1 hypothetical protein NCH01_11880 [Neoasaia chiangmaiensis]
MQADAGTPIRSRSHPSRFIVARLLGLVAIAAMVSFQVGPAAAETPAKADATAAAPRLSNAQAQQLLGVLKDDTRRQQFITTLQNLTVAQEAAPAGAAKAPTADPKSLRPDGLGADLVGGLTSFGHSAGHQTQALFRTVVDFREIAPWTRQIERDPQAQARILQLLIRAAILIVVSGALFVLVRLALRKPRRKLEEAARIRSLHELVDERHDRQAAEAAANRDAAAESSAETASPATGAAPQESPALPPGTDSQAEDAPEKASRRVPVGDEIADDPEISEPEKIARNQAEIEEDRAARVRHQGALARLMLSIRRLPYTFGAFLLDLMPVAMVPLTALVVAAADPGATPATETALRDIALVAMIGGSAVAVARALLAPSHPWLRLLMISNWAAEYLFRWTRLLVIIGATGAAIIGLLGDCALPDAITTALAKVLALILHVSVAVMILRSRAHVMALCQRATRIGYASHALLLVGRVWWIAALFFDLSLWLVWAAEIRHGYAAIWEIFLRSVAALVIVRILSIATYGLLERAFRLAPDWAALTDDTKGRLSAYYPIARRILGVLTVLVTVLALAVAWGVPVRALFGPGGIGSRVASSTFTILVALTLAAVVWEIANLAMERHMKRVVDLEDGKVRVARIRTLQPMMRIILMVVLSVVIGLTVLSQLGINTGPLLAGASIFGVALGFGSQKLVQDFINGIFLLLENALTVGDAVTLNGTYGIVERLSLRTVHVRANDGSMNIFPFSSLGQITNYNRDFARAIIVAEVGYDVDTDDVVKAINDITAEMRADPDFKDLIIDDFQMWGVDSLNDSSVTVRGTLPTTTAGRWPVQRQFYRRMKKCFDARGITIPFPTRTLEIDGLEKLVNYRVPSGMDAAPPPKEAAEVQTGAASKQGE